MAPHASNAGARPSLARAAGQWVTGWWRIVRLAALLLVLALSPSSYSAQHRRNLARHIYLDTAPTLLWFTVLSTLISLVVIRIVLVTALSYGLSQYALEMVVRVLVLELIPLTAAVFAALRCTIPNATEVADVHARGGWDPWSAAGLDPLQREVLPRVGSGVFCALMLAATSCVITLVLAYLAVYGPTWSGFAAYTNTVGHVFSTAVALIFALKIGFLSITVALVPIASMLDEAPAAHVRTSAELRGVVRMFLIVLAIEAASLVGNYY